MIKKLLLLLTLCPAYSLIAAPSLDNDSYTAYNKHFAVKHISKRDGTSCQTNRQYLFNTTTDAICCYSCDPGYVAERIGCTKDNPRTNCKRCTEGQEYMDKPNHKTKCLRCNGCDRQHGLEVETNCTIMQNVKCKCMPGFFCDSKPCQHCDHCDKCENGVILEKCTETQNTKCKRREDVHRGHWLLLLPVIVLPVVVILIWKTTLARTKQKMQKILPGEDTTVEMEPFNYPDIDLTPHIPDIAEEMKIEEVKKLVRKLSVSPIRIEEIMLSNNNDVSEQKIKLLECWYQEKGRRNAYGSLISTLKNLHFRATADRIEQKIRHDRDDHTI